MRFALRRWLSIFLAVWLPLQTAAVLAMPMYAQEGAATEAVAHDHGAHHGHAGHADDNGKKSSGAGMDCELCGLCVQIHGGVMVSNFVQEISPLPAESRIALALPVPTLISDIPHRPPIELRA